MVSWGLAVTFFEKTAISIEKRLQSFRFQLQNGLKTSILYHFKAFRLYKKVGKVRGPNSTLFVRYSRYFFEKTPNSIEKRLQSIRTQLQNSLKTSTLYHFKEFRVYNKVEKVRGPNSTPFVRYSRYFFEKTAISIKKRLQSFRTQLQISFKTSILYLF